MFRVLLSSKISTAGAAGGGTLRAGVASVKRSRSFLRLEGINRDRRRRHEGDGGDRWVLGRSDGLADGVEDPAELAAQEDERDDSDDRDEGEDQGVLGESLAFVIVSKR